MLSPALRAFLALPWRDQRRWLARKLREALPGTTRIRSADRALLEEELLPAYAADARLEKLLFVGCDWYTRDYPALFDPDRSRFRSIDFDAKKAVHGTPDHIVAPLQEIDRHVAAQSADVVVCNGVYGFGIHDRVELARAFAAAHAVLRPGGALLLGWNNVRHLGPFDPVEAALAAGFVRDPARSGRWRVETDTPTRHTFDFYIRPSP